MTTGLNFSKIAAKNGYHLFDYVEYPSLIRGGHNNYEVLVSNEEVRQTKRAIDLLVCLDKESYFFNVDRLVRKTIVVYDPDNFTLDRGEFIPVAVPFGKILQEEQVPAIMLNNVALGASLALMGWQLTFLDEIFVKTFAKKGEEVVEKNKKVTRRGFEHVINNYSSLINHDFPLQTADQKIILSGNDSFSLGAVVANCGLYAAYPMTPASSVLTTLAGYAEKTGMIVRHAEDEIAVINTAIGSSWAGVRSAVGTSGGGFALMVEGISLAGMLETPLVIFLSQRPAPATGMPTWTEQGDLLFAVNAGHGDFPKIVLAPGDAQEMFDLTIKAFDLADIYQTPVIVLSDKFLSESHKSTSLEEFSRFAQNYKPNRGKIIKEFFGKKYLRYQLTDGGISPMLIPGQKGVFYQSNSYEHLEDGHTTEEAEERRQQVDKRNSKLKTYLDKDFCCPKIYGDLQQAQIVFVSWGSNKGPVLEALKTLGERVALIHFSYVFPLDEQKIRSLFFAKKRYILVENNSTCQFGRLLREQAGIEIKENLLKYDGRPFWPEEIIEYVKP